MTNAYRVPPRRGVVVRGLAFVDDFMNWLLYGHETWLVALLKAIPLFLYVYFLLTYVPNYVYYLSTQYIPFLKFSEAVGFLLAAMVGGGNFLVLIILALWTQAARGRRGFGWSLIRALDFMQLLFVLLLMIPLLAFNLGGGSFVPPLFPLEGVVLAMIAGGMGAATLVYLYLEFRRITRREAQAAAAASAAYSAG